MNVQLIIDGVLTELTPNQRIALKQACGMEQHNCLRRRDNCRSKHLQESYMDQALFLERTYKSLYVPIDSTQ